MPLSAGVYGFRIAGLDDGSALLDRVPADWPLLQIERLLGNPDAPEPPGTAKLHDDGASLWIGGGDRIDVLRDPARVRFTTAEPIGPDAVLHPFLGIPASIASSWLGRISLHGGAFVHRDRAWALLGEQEAGKSATLGWLLRSGHQILSDDILIVEGTTIFSGPRSVDLRAGAAELVGGEPLGVIGARERFRLRPRQGAPSLPLAGFVKLEWGEQPALAPLDSADRLRALVANSVLRPGPQTAEQLLAVAALPAWRFVRPKGIRELGALTDQLLGGIDTPA